jgi:hypothetical protein
MRGRHGGLDTTEKFKLWGAQTGEGKVVHSPAFCNEDRAPSPVDYYIV